MNRPQTQLQNRISLDDLELVKQPITNAKGMPNAAYTDDAFFAFERDQIIARHWTAIGFVQKIAPSSVKPVDFMGLPLLVTRSAEGAISVFHNVCSHRGMRLVNEEKRTNGLIVCPYHSWTYALSGDLKATPHIGGVGIHTADGFSCDGKGLKPVRFHIWLGILFVNLDGKALPFEQDAAQPLQRYRELMGVDGEEQIHAPAQHNGLTMQLQCNWKLAIENYLEAYHLPFIHPDLNSYSPLSEHIPEIFGDKCAGQITNTFDPKLDSDHPFPLFPNWKKDQLQVGEYPVIYPNLMLGFQSNHLFALIVVPTSVTQCREELQLFYVGDEIDAPQYEDGLKHNLEAWAQVFNEDVEPCERMQIGRQSPGYQGGAFSPVLDKCSHHFHQWMADQYSEAYQSPN